jgi:hypothetical protein
MVKEGGDRAMKTWVFIYMATLAVSGCKLFGEDRIKTFTVQQVTEENVLAFGPVFVKINPDLQYSDVSGDIKVEIMGQEDKPTKKKFHIFTRSGSNHLVFIETHTRSHPHTFIENRVLTKNMAVIQKGTKSIDGKIWELYVRALPEFPEQILSAVRQKGIRIESYRCGLEIGVARLIDRHNRIYISYIRGEKDCKTLPPNGGVLNDQQIQHIREFAALFDANISISDQTK